MISFDYKIILFYGSWTLLLVGGAVFNTLSKKDENSKKKIFFAISGIGSVWLFLLAQKFRIPLEVWFLMILTMIATNYVAYRGWKYCKKCKAEIPNAHFSASRKYCPNCGTSLISLNQKNKK